MLRTLAALPLHHHCLFGLTLLLPRLRSLSRQRRALLDLDDRRLDDIGLTRAQAREEAARPIWDAPAHWRR